LYSSINATNYNNFRKLSPNETLFLEPTQTEKEPLKFLNFEVLDYPAHLTEIYLNSGALIFVIDAQDDYLEALQRLYWIITQKKPTLSIVIVV
jgi:Ras-related GTP-binding protein C/D